MNIKRISLTLFVLIFVLFSYLKAANVVKLNSISMIKSSDKVILKIKADRPVIFKKFIKGNIITLLIKNAVVSGNYKTYVPVESQDVKDVKTIANKNTVKVIITLFNKVKSDIYSTGNSVKVVLTSLYEGPMTTKQYLQKHQTKKAKKVEKKEVVKKQKVEKKSEKVVVKEKKEKVVVKVNKKYTKNNSVYQKPLYTTKQVLVKNTPKKVKKEVKDDIVYIDLQMQSADIQDVIRLISEKTGWNLIIDKDVKGEVTLKLNHVPAERALALILASLDYGYKKIGNIVYVGPFGKLEKVSAIKSDLSYAGDLKTQVIQLENAKAADLAPTIKTQFKNDPLEISVDSRINALIVKAPLDTIKRVKALVGQLDVPAPPPPPEIPPETEVIRLNYADANDVSTQLTSFAPKGAIIVDKRLNALIVTGTPSVIDTVKKFVEAVDVPLKQVELEIKVVDLTASGEKNLGLDYSAGASAFTFNFSEKMRMNNNSMQSATSPWADPNPGFDKMGFHTFVRDPVKFNVTLNLLAQSQDAKILAKPKIVTMSGYEATINAGKQIPLVYYDPRAGMYQSQPQDVGVILTVKPIISPDGYVTMELNPQVSTIIGYNQQYPILSTREAKTTVRVKSGDTIIIAGLLKTNETKSFSKLPFLGDIPILGEFFKNRHNTNEKTDLVFMVTPRILKDY